MKVYKSPSGGQPAQANGAAPKVVGPNIMGTKEEYQLVRRLQSALFGGVYEAKGLSSNRDFAIKVLHKSELSKAQKVNSIEFCEVPLSEIRFAELMRGSEHVMEAEDHFEDAYCFYIVFELARGGDLLEALKQKPNGFEECQAQFLIKQAAKGLAYLHSRRVAMQDVSLENMLLHVRENPGQNGEALNQFQIKVCDPGQAVVFEVDPNTGEELPVKFRGLVGKSFRPLELHNQESYYSTKVDAWCLGWSTFYLLTAQPLFMSADPVQQDPDWALFKNGDYAKLFQQKQCSLPGLDFILRLLQLDPKRRMSVNDALNHEWLTDPRVPPMFAPKELCPPPKKPEQNSEVESDAAPAQRDGGTRASPAVPLAPSSPEPSVYETDHTATYLQAGTSSPTIGGGQLAGRNVGVSYGPVHPVRVRSPVRSPRSGPIQQQGVVPSSQDRDRRAGAPTQQGQQKMTHARSSSSSISSWVQTASGAMTRTQSPVPSNNAPTSPPHGMPSRTQVRGNSPLSSTHRTSHSALSPLLRRSLSPSPSLLIASGEAPYYRDQVTQMYQPASQTSFHTPRSTRPPTITAGGLTTNINGKAEPDFTNDGVGSRGRAWAFRSEGASLGDSQTSTDIQNAMAGDPRHRPRTSSPGPVPAGAVPWSSGASTSSALLLPSANARQAAQSPPPRTTPQWMTSAQRSLSPMSPGNAQVPRLQAVSTIGGNSQTREPAVMPGVRHSPRAGSPTTPFKATEANELHRGRPISPRLAGPLGASAANVVRGASPGPPQMVSKPLSRPGFAWSPEPPSPPAPTRSFSPAPMAFTMVKGRSNGNMRWMG